MLRDYFSMEINDLDELVSIPLLLKGYMPCLGKLPGFLLRLGPNVSLPLSARRHGCLRWRVDKVIWNSELECFETFLCELARFYVPPPGIPTPPPGTGSSSSDGSGSSSGEDNQRRVVETVLFPAFRKRLIPARGLLASVAEVANLRSLYRIFERSC